MLIIFCLVRNCAHYEIAQEDEARSAGAGNHLANQIPLHAQDPRHQKVDRSTYREGISGTPRGRGIGLLGLSLFSNGRRYNEYQYPTIHAEFHNAFMMIQMSDCQYMMMWVMASQHSHGLGAFDELSLRLGKYVCFSQRQNRLRIFMIQ